MDCKKVKKELSSYLDNEINLDQKSKVKEHLKKCKACSYQLKQLRQIQSLVQKIPSQKPEPGFYERLSSRLSKKKITLKERLFGWGYIGRLSPRVAIVASIVLILSISSLYLWRSSSISGVNIEVFQKEYIYYSNEMSSFAEESVLPVLLEIK